MLPAKNSVLTLIGAVLLGAIPVSAQQSFGSISGVVQDSQGAVVPNAKVELTNQAQGAVVEGVPVVVEGW